MALFNTGNHFAIVRSTNLLRDFLTPSIGFVNPVRSCGNDCGVALRFEPGLANDLWLLLDVGRFSGLTFFHQRHVATEQTLTR